MCVCFWGKHRGLNVAYSWRIWSNVRPSWNGAQSPCSLTPSDCWAKNRQLILHLAGVSVYPASSLVNLGNHVLSLLLTVSQHVSSPLILGSYRMGVMKLFASEVYSFLVSFCS